MEQETTHWAIRIPNDMAERVDLVILELEEKNGFPVSRTAAIKMLLARGLDNYRKKKQ